MTATNGDTHHAGADTLIDLAENISSQTRAISEYLAKNGTGPLSFAADASEPPNTAEYLELYNNLKTSCDDLGRLVEGPRRWLRSYVSQINELAALQVAFEFRLFTLVPENSDIDVHDLAAAAGLDADRIARTLRLLVTHRLFDEKKPGRFSHSASSELLRRDEELRCAGHYTVDEMFKAAASTAESLRASPDQSDALHCAFNTTHGAPMFQYYGERPALAARFAKAMAGVNKLDRPTTQLRDAYPWKSLSGTVVDIGGGNGHMCVSLANKFPELDFIIQDGSADMLAQGKKGLPADLTDRVTYMQHNFFTPQPQRDVAALLLRQVTHNWSDRDLITILRALVPCLEGSAPGTPLLINDRVLPELGSYQAHQERVIRQVDVLMMLGLGAKQRSRKEFEMVLKQADERYAVKHVYIDETTGFGLIETHLCN